MATLFRAAFGDAAELRIRFRNERGDRVTISGATLLLAYWGGGEQVELKAGSPELVLDLNAAWLSSHASHPDAVEFATLLVSAKGYAPIESDPFAWLGFETHEGRGGKASETEIRLKDKAANISLDAVASLTLTFRRPGRRTLKLVDERGHPIGGVKVSSYMFWTARSHCGWVSRDHPLGDAVSDGDGLAFVPDADVKYAFVFDKPHYVLKLPLDPAQETTLVTGLSSDETRVQFHFRRKKALAMRVTENGRPAAGRNLRFWMAGCPGGLCGACDGPGATSDSNGMIRLPGFRPEEYESIYFEATSGKRIWQADPRTWKGTGTVDVELPVEPP